MNCITKPTEDLYHGLLPASQPQFLTLSTYSYHTPLTRCDSQCPQSMIFSFLYRFKDKESACGLQQHLLRFKICLDHLLAEAWWSGYTLLKLQYLLWWGGSNWTSQSLFVRIKWDNAWKVSIQCSAQALVIFTGPYSESSKSITLNRTGRGSPGPHRTRIPVRACMLNYCSHVWLFATPWTVAHQVPLSMGFSRQEYWKRLPFPLLGIFLT